MTPVPSDMLSSYGASSPSLPSPSLDPSAVPTSRGKIACNVPFCLYKPVTCVTMLKGSSVVNVFVLYCILTSI